MKYTGLVCDYSDPNGELRRTIAEWCINAFGYCWGDVIASQYTHHDNRGGVSYDLKLHYMFWDQTHAEMFWLAWKELDIRDR